MSALASALLARAAATLPSLPAAERTAALAAIDAFVGDARPSRFLAAHRALAEAARARARERAAPHHFQRAVEALGAASLDPDVIAVLASLPADARTAARLETLAWLLLAHGELAARAAAATAALRARLERR